MPSAAQVTVPSVGQTEGDMSKGSLGVVVLGERFASTPLTPSIVGGGVPTGMSRQEGSVTLGADGESSLTLISVGSGSPTWGEPLLQWMNPQDPVSMLFTLDAAAESMERESLNVGIASMLEALDHATGALHDVVVPSDQVMLGPASFPFLPLYTFCILTFVSL